MANEWYYTPSGSETVGPVSFEDLRRAVLDEIVTPATAVWTQRMGSEWQRADTVPELRKVWNELDVVHSRAIFRLVFNRFSVSDSIKQAFSKTKTALFKPFIFLKWIVISICTWMAGSSAIISFADKETFKVATPDISTRGYIELFAASNISGLKQIFIPQISIPWVITVFLFCLIVSYVCVKGRLMFLAKAYKPDLPLSFCWHNSIRRTRTLLLFYTFISIVSNFAMATCLYHFCLDMGYFSGHVFSLNEIMSNPKILLSAPLITGSAIFFFISFVKSYTFHFVEPMVYNFGVPIITAFKVTFKIYKEDPARYFKYYLFVAIYRIIYTALVILALGLLSILFSLTGLPSSIFLGGLPLAISAITGKLIFLPLDYFYRVVGTKFNN